MKNKIISAITQEKIIVIVRGVESKKLIPLVSAMYDGGIRLLELTYDASVKISDSETADNIKLLSDHFCGKMFIGAGTVIKPEQVDLTHKAGGSFIISPNTDLEIIRRTCELNMVSMPGALTPSEIQSAHSFGADFVKVFPAGNFGPGYIKAVRAPLSHIKLTAVGGINENNISEYINAGACGVGVGANIVDKTLIAENNFEGIRALAEKYVKAVK